MSKKCDAIGLGKINKYMLLIFLGTVFNVLLYQVGDFSKFFKDTCQHPVIYNLAYSFGLCLSFIIYIKYICDNRRKRQGKNIINCQTIINQEPTKASFIIVPNKKIISEKEKIAWIFLVSVIDYISMFFNSYYWIESDKYFINWPFGLIIMSLSSYLILKTKMYKHHYLSASIILIFGIVYLIVSRIFTKENIEKYYMSYIFTFLSENIFNVLYVVYKFYMVKKFIKSFEILFYEGIFETVIGIITLIITTKIGKIDNFWDYYNNINSIEVIIFISLIISNFATFLIKLIVIDLFSPFYGFLITMLSEIISFLFGMSFKDSISIIALVFFILGLFLVLIYIEVIELNFCGLSDMTKKNIEIRAQNDELLAKSEEKEEEEDKISNRYGYEFSLDNESNKDTNENIDKNMKDKNVTIEMKAINQEDNIKS